MNPYEKTRRLFQKNRGILTTKEAKRHGIDSDCLRQMVRFGEIQRLARGIYFNALFGDYERRYVFQLQNPTCIYSHESALYLHQLVDCPPEWEEVTVPQGYNAWRIKEKVHVHWTEKKYYPLEIVTVMTPQGNRVRAYGPERTLCDVARAWQSYAPSFLADVFWAYEQKAGGSFSQLFQSVETFGCEKAMEMLLRDSFPNA